MKRDVVFKLFILIFISFILYFPTLSFYFCNDDFERIGPYKFSETIKCFYDKCQVSEHKISWYRPTTGLLYFLEYYLYKYNAWGYHLTNLILHILCTILVYFLAIVLIKKENIAFLSSIFFALHPIHTDAVSWICTRHSFLVTLFYLLSLIFFIKYLNSKKTKFYIYSIFFFIFSLCSKEEAVTLPLVILLSDLLIFPRKFLLKEKLKLYSPYFFTLFLYFLFRIFILKSFGAYGDKFILFKYPFPLSSNVKYFITNKLEGLFVPYTQFLIPGFFIFLIILIPPLLFYLKFKDFSFLTAFLLINILPFINIPINPNTHGWYMYLTSVSFCILLAMFISLLFKFPSKYYKIIGSLLIIIISTFYIYATINRINDWRVSSELCREIPLKIKAFFTESIKPNTKIYVYGIPYHYKGAYVYATGFGKSLKMTFNNNSLIAYKRALLRFPFEIFEKENLSNTFFFAYIYGEMFRIIFHPEKKNYLIFVNKEGKYFEVSFEEYNKLSKKIIESYLSKNGRYPTAKQMEINEKIVEGLTKIVSFHLYENLLKAQP